MCDIGQTKLFILIYWPGLNYILELFQGSSLEMITETVLYAYHKVQYQILCPSMRKETQNKIFTLSISAYIFSLRTSHYDKKLLSVFSMRFCTLVHFLCIGSVDGVTFLVPVLLRKIMNQFSLISTIYPIGGLNRRANSLLISQKDYCKMKANNGKPSHFLFQEVMTNI